MIRVAPWAKGMHPHMHRLTTGAGNCGSNNKLSEANQLMPILTRQKRWILPRLTPILAVFGVIVAASSCATAQESTGALAATTRGIEHVLYLAVRSDPTSPLLTPANGQPKAKLLVRVRISAHSQEANFFGFLPAAVPEFDLAKGSEDKEIWRDGKCHHERGFPKITVTAVDGVVTSGQEQHAVTARWRTLGLILPHDEVLAAKKLDNGADKIGSYIATRTETKQSRLFLDLKLYILPCDLTVAGVAATGKP